MESKDEMIQTGQVEDELKEKVESIEADTELKDELNTGGEFVPKIVETNDMQESVPAETNIVLKDDIPDVTEYTEYTDVNIKKETEDFKEEPNLTSNTIKTLPSKDCRDDSEVQQLKSKAEETGQKVEISIQNGSITVLDDEILSKIIQEEKHPEEPPIPSTTVPDNSEVESEAKTKKESSIPLTVPDNTQVKIDVTFFLY